MEDKKEKKPQELTDEQMNKAAGGESGGPQIQCSKCGQYRSVLDISLEMRPYGVAVPVCKYCKGKNNT